MSKTFEECTLAMITNLTIAVQSNLELLKAAFPDRAPALQDVVEHVKAHTTANVLGLGGAAKAIRKKRSKYNADGTPKQKRAMTGYLLFCNNERKDLGGEFKPMEAVSELARRWKLLTDLAKKDWNDKAAAMSKPSEVTAVPLMDAAAAEAEEAAKRERKRKKKEKKAAEERARMATAAAAQVPHTGLMTTGMVAL